MKGKATTYILLFLVIAIWAWVMYNIYDYVGEEDSGFNIKTGLKKTDHTKPVEEKKRYVLKLNYIDPFLKKAIKFSENTATGQTSYIAKERPASSLIQPVKEETPVVLPQYLGLIANKKGSVAILAFEGKEYMVKEGDHLGDVVLSKITRDSVKLILNKKVYYAKKN